MSRLKEFRQLQQALAQQIAELEALKDDPQLRKDIEFESGLRALMAEYGKSLPDIVSILDPDSTKPFRAQAAMPAKATRRPRTVKVYRNPLTGEIVESKGGNNRLLGAWKSQFGHDAVESWVKQ